MLKGGGNKFFGDNFKRSLALPSDMPRCRPNLFPFKQAADISWSLDSGVKERSMFYKELNGDKNFSI
jgi:hypothetical protein